MSTPNGVAADVASDVDKRSMWPTWTKRFEWQDKLYKRAAHKSLDIPDDDMQINKTTVGIGTLGAMGIAGMAGIPSTLIALALMFGGDKEPVATVPPPVVTQPGFPPDFKVPDSSYAVEFWELDENGKPVRRVLVDPLNPVEPSK